MPTPQQKKRRRKQRKKQRQRRAEAEPRPEPKWLALQSDRVLVAMSGVSLVVVAVLLVLRISLVTALIVHLCLFSVATAALFVIDQRLRYAGTGRVNRFAMQAGALLGGAAGAMSVMMVQGHLSDHPRFRRTVPIALAVHVVLVAFAL